MKTTLAVTTRTKAAAKLRAAGQIPAVVYGPKQEPISIAIDKNTFEKLLRDAGESTIISLTGLDDEIEVLIQDASFDAAKGGLDHVDFYAIERGKELTANVPLEFIGEAPAEKTGAMITKVMYDIEVTCRPSQLPGHIDVDLSGLTEEGQHILIKDLALSKDLTLTAELDDVVVTVSGAREEEPEEPVETPDMDEIEVEAKGKDDGEEGDAETDEEKDK